jgi:putative membrane protein
MDPGRETIESRSDVSKDSTRSVPRTSKRVSDHLANERTFLAWIRTGLATITFGFVVERFGLLVRELGLKGVPVNSFHYSALIGVSLTILGIIIMIAALVNFLRIRFSIDREDFHPQISFSIILTVLACLIGLLLAYYLLSTA